jgi:hypothetical protein
MATDLDEKLRAFLQDHEDTRRRGYTLESIGQKQDTLTDGLLAHSQEDKAEFRALHDKLDTRFASHDHRLTTVEATLTKGVEPRLEKVEETTGNHDIAGILKAAKGLNGRESGRESGRPGHALLKAFDTEIGKWVGRALGVVLVAVATWVVHDLAHAARPAAPAPPSARP